METAQNGFNRLKNEIIRTFKLKDHDLPACYHAAKTRPKLTSGVLSVAECKHLEEEHKHKKKTREGIK